MYPCIFIMYVFAQLFLYAYISFYVHILSHVLICSVYSYIYYLLFSSKLLICNMQYMKLNIHVYVFTITFINVCVFFNIVSIFPLPTCEC